MEKIEMLMDIIRARRSVFPPLYSSDREVPVHVIEKILEAANWAPSHKKTEPWRFYIFTGKSREALGKFMADYYLEHTPEADFSQVVFNKMMQNPLKAPVLIAIVMHRDVNANLPEWEEIAATSCAIQNMALACTAEGLGSFWSTPRPILNSGPFLKLTENERCLGLFYIGHAEKETPIVPRGPVSAKTFWMDGEMP
jgi:nitroreductase